MCFFCFADFIIFRQFADRQPHSAIADTWHSSKELRKMRAEHGTDDEATTRAAVALLLAVPVPKVANRGDVDAANRKQLRDTFGACWTEALRGAMDETTLRCVLRVLPEAVLPCVAQPLTLVDMLDAAYVRGGVASVLALRGVFYLMSRHNLDVPDFYTKLYALLDAQLLCSRHRDEFFAVAERFLASGYLPAQMVAAFVKRTARLSLHAPAAALLVTMPFASNLLCHHDRVRATLIANTLEQQKKQQQQAGSDAAATATWEDPFDETAKDPAKAHALESTLWEFVAMRDHFVPAVSRLAGIFRIHAGGVSGGSEGRAKEKGVDNATLHNVSEFAGLSYRTLFDMEALPAATVPQRARDAKDVALEFRPWTSLFGDAAAVAGSAFCAWQLPAATDDVSGDRLV